MTALERTAPKAAAQARTLAAQPEAAVDERVRAQVRQLESIREQVRAPRLSRGMSMGRPD